MPKITPKRVCCAPCHDRGFCRVASNCCLECHMAYEVRYVGQYLSRDELTWLVQDHARIAAAGFPADMLRKHSEREEQIFRDAKVPPEVLRQVLDDHTQWEQGQLLSRADGGT